MAIEFVLQEILNGFDVMIGGFFNIFDLFSVIKIKFGDYFLKIGVCFFWKTRNFCDVRGAGKGLDPVDFNKSAKVNEPVFASYVA